MAQYDKLKKLARKLFNNTFKGKYNFDEQQCFTSSSEKEGFYFPNLDNGYKAIVFENNKPLWVKE